MSIQLQDPYICDLSRGKKCTKLEKVGYKGSRDPDRNDGLYQGSLAKRRNLDRAESRPYQLHIIQL